MAEPAPFDAAARYRELLGELLAARDAAGGSLPDERESRYVAELDRHWNAMTTAEQEAVDPPRWAVSRPATPTFREAEAAARAALRLFEAAVAHHTERKPAVAFNCLHARRALTIAMLNLWTLSVDNDAPKEP